MAVLDDIQQITDDSHLLRVALLKLLTTTNVQNERIVEAGQRLTDFEDAMKVVREAFDA